MVEKLVRDKIPEIIRSEGGNPEFRRAKKHEVLPLLKAKLMEELAEFEAVYFGMDGEQLEELADLMEVVRSLCFAAGHHPGTVERVRRRKEARKGGFGEWYVMTVPEAR